MSAPASNPTIDIGLVPRKKVLVAEDEENIAALVDDWLSEQYEVVIAFNGKSALQKAKWQQPDIILMDIMMPDMGGYEVVRALQSDPQTRHISVIAMTAKAFDDSTVKLIKGEANVMGFINKPFKRDSLRSKIEQVLSGQRLLEAPAAEPLDLTPPDAAAPAEAAPSLAPAPAGAPAPPQAQFSMPRPAEPVQMGRTISKEAAAAPVVRRGWGTFSLLAAAGLAALIGGEVAARLAEPLGDAALPPLEASRWPEVPYELSAGAAWRPAGVAYALNAWGLRGRASNLGKSPEEIRVYVLGGSSVFGQGVPDAQTAVERLEMLLNRDRADAGGAEVINGGLWGFRPAEQWAHYRRVGAQFHPDALVWVTSPTDPAPLRRAALESWLSLPGALRGLLERTGLGRLASRRWIRDAAGFSGPEDAALREEASRFAASENTRFLTASLSDPELALDESAFAADGTLNAAGHKILAEALARKLREEPKN